jgi:hypothetical protein
MTVHKTEAYRGEHEAIIDERLWNEAQSINREPPRTRGRLSKPTQRRYCLPGSW